MKNITQALSTLLGNLAAAADDCEPNNPARAGGIRHARSLVVDAIDGALVLMEREQLKKCEAEDAALGIVREASRDLDRAGRAGRAVRRMEVAA